MDEAKQIPPAAVELINQLLANGLVDLAKERLKTYGIKHLKIEFGKLIDTSESTDAWLNKFITINPKMLELKDDVRKLAKVQDEVLISGPTGTGKELIARALHGEKEGKFQAINCAGLPSELVESELFGHKVGSFTGAHKDKIGLMQVASKGTLFLDEVGELPLAVQAKFLRAIEQKEIRRVGDDKEIQIDCRIVCATHRDIKSMVERDLFRQDLYARISTFELRTTGLEERREDVLAILQSIDGGSELCDKLDKSQLDLDLSLGVRSLKQLVRRYKVFGRIV